MGKKPVMPFASAESNPTNNSLVSASDKSFAEIPIDFFKRFTIVDIAMGLKGKNDSDLKGGSRVLGVHVLKSGEYAGKRLWHLAYDSNSRVYIGSTEKSNSNQWVGKSFSEKEYFEKSRDKALEQMVQEFLDRINYEKGKI